MTEKQRNSGRYVHFIYLAFPKILIISSFIYLFSYLVFLIQVLNLFQNGLFLEISILQGELSAAGNEQHSKSSFVSPYQLPELTFFNPSKAVEASE